MNWKKVTKANTLREFVLEKTGLTPEEIMSTHRNYEFQRFSEVRNIIQEARSNGLVVKIVGDYDCDGVTSVLILMLLMSAIGIKYELYMPKRMSEGYGLSSAIVDRMEPDGILITIDNGIKALEGIQKAKEKGMKVVILDHHEAGEELPNADVIVDPTAVGEADYTHYCGAGIACKLAEYILGKNHQYMPVISGIAAIGTIGDCVELTGDNRNIVKNGLKRLKEGKTLPAIADLLQKSKITETSSAMDIAFNVVPAINAPGRIYDSGAEIALGYLVQMQNVEPFIDKLLEINNYRKNLIAYYMQKIDLETLNKSNKKAIFLYDNEIIEGLVGVVAGKITEATNRPSFVFTDAKESGCIKGSVRSDNDNYSIFDIIEKHKNLYLKAGGHKKAAGLTILKDDLKNLEAAVCKELPLAQPMDFIPYDLEVNEADFINVARDILEMEPFGEGNPMPIIRTRIHLKSNEKGDTFIYMGDKKEHLKFFCGDFSAVAFRQASKITESKPQFIDMIGRVAENMYKNKKSIQFIITDFRIY